MTNTTKNQKNSQILVTILIAVCCGAALAQAQAPAKAKDAIPRIHPPFTRRNE